MAPQIGPPLKSRVSLSKLFNALHEEFLLPRAYSPELTAYAMQSPPPLGSGPSLAILLETYMPFNTMSLCTVTQEHLLVTLSTLTALTSLLQLLKLNSCEEYIVALAIILMDTAALESTIQHSTQSLHLQTSVLSLLGEPENFGYQRLYRSLRASTFSESTGGGAAGKGASPAR